MNQVNSTSSVEYYGSRQTVAACQKFVLLPHAWMSTDSPSFVIKSEYIKGQSKGSECRADETGTKVGV